MLRLSSGAAGVLSFDMEESAKPAKTSNKKALVKCPICGCETDFFAEPMGPFCSKRCKLIDLGKWLSEDYKISEPLRADHFEKYASLESGEELDRPEREP